MTKDVVIWEQVLQPGTAVIVGLDANSKVKHGVPKINQPVGVSGSFVGRAIATRMAWKVMEKNANKLYKKRVSGAVEKAAVKKAKLK